MSKFIDHQPWGESDMLKSLWIACLVGLALFWSSLSLADSKETCPEKSFGGKRIGLWISTIEEEGEHLYISSYNHKLQVPRDDAQFYGGFLGTDMLIDYELMQYWSEQDKHCVQEPVIFKIRFNVGTESDDTLYLKLTRYIQNDEKYTKKLDLTYYKNYPWKIQLTSTKKDTKEHNKYKGSCFLDKNLLRCSITKNNGTSAIIAVHNYDNTLEVIEAPDDFLRGTYLKDKNFGLADQ